MIYSEELIDEIREKNDIADVVSSYIKITKKGRNYSGLCPFHNEKTPSFQVSGEKQIFKCFGCGAGGNVFGFVMKYENLTFKEAVQELATRAGVDLPTENYSEQKKKENDKKALLFEINKIAATFYFYQLQKPNNAGLKYLMQRDLTMETIRRFGLGFANKTSDELYRVMKSKGYDDLTLKDSGLFKITEKSTLDKFWNRVMFPILDRNSKVIGFGGRVMGDGMPKYLNSPDTLLFDKSKTLYGLNLAKNTKEDSLILCEGYMDVIAIYQSGFTNAIAALGTAFTPSHANILKRYTKKVVLCFDSDNAGIKATNHAIQVLRDNGISVRVLNLSPYKDPDEFMKALGKEAFSERVQSAKNAFLWKMEILQKDYNFSDPEQKTQYLHKIAEELAKFEDVIERENYIQVVAKEQVIDFKDLRGLVNRIGNKEYIRKEIEEAREVDRKFISKKRDYRSGVVKGQAILLTFCMEDEMIFQMIKDLVKPSDFQDSLYIEAAALLYEEYERGKPNLSKLLSKFDENEEKQAQFVEIFDSKYSAEIATSDRKKVVQEILTKMKLSRLEERKEEIANSYDIVEFQRVIKEINELRQKGIQLNW